MELLLESNLIYSTKFEDILKKIKTPLALDLLSIKGKDIDQLRYNRIDIIDDKDDTVKFISQDIDDIIIPRKVSLKNPESPSILYFTHTIIRGLIDHLTEEEIMKYRDKDGVFRILSPSHYTPSDNEGTIIKYFSSNILDDIHRNKLQTRWYDIKGVYLFCCSVENKLFLVYEDGIENDLYGGKTPSEIKIGRLITRILPKLPNIYSAKDIEEFVNEYKAQISKLNDEFSNFEIVKGEDIRKWYNYSNYSNSYGTLGNSCMRYHKCQPFFDVYCNNPDKINLVILKDDDNKLTGRAILWYLDNGNILMDRIYSNMDSDVKLFIEFALSKNWFYKKSQNSQQSKFTNNETILSSVKITLNLTNIDKWPYMDTMAFLDKDNNILSNDKDLLEIEYPYDLCSTDGYICNYCRGTDFIYCKTCEGSKEISCDKCNGYGHIPGKTYESPDIICPECDGKKYHVCPTCNGSGKEPCKHIY